MENKKKLLWTLFSSTFKISACTFGGGYVIVPLIRKRFVEDLQWIDEQEMLDLISVAQFSPGPIAVNTSVMVGYRMAGVLGALICALGTILPPMLIISLISLFYNEFRQNRLVNGLMLGMQAGVAAVICNVIIDMAKKVIVTKKLLDVLLMLGVFAAVFFFKINILWCILACGLIGYVNGTWKAKQQGGAR